MLVRARVAGQESDFSEDRWWQPQMKAALCMCPGANERSSMMRRVALGCGLAMLWLLPGCRRAEDLDLMLRQAATAAAASDWFAAAELAERCTRIAPRNLDALLLHGRCLLAQRHLDEAIDCFERAVAQAELHFLPHFFLGWTLSEAERCGDAMTPLRRAYELIPRDSGARPDLLVLLSRCCLDNNLAEGERYLNELREYRAFAQSPDVFNALGMLHVNLQEYEEAARDFKTALRHDEGNAVVLQNLAVLYDQYLQEPHTAMDYYLYCRIASHRALDRERERKIHLRLRQLAEERRERGDDDAAE
jgi:tetratricopeptide (TPR) repeat protein